MAVKQYLLSEDYKVQSIAPGEDEDYSILLESTNFVDDRSSDGLVDRAELYMLSMPDFFREPSVLSGRMA
ncbi:hypothetical protein Slin15195_G085280 [Septoria linicola]|uniref:Uncharacterized protein n=1 Tax=Septoria linicola TaxID=215465 RepID=A0A9Q9AUT0_9PEZI|nr:hypothetical protein Slin15195_G085280 [Septoria linicola]